MKIGVIDTYKKVEKISTSFKPTDDTDVINKAYLDTKLFGTEVHISKIEKDYGQFILLSKKQFAEEVLIEKAV